MKAIFNIACFLLIGAYIHAQEAKIDSNSSPQIATNHAFAKTTNIASDQIIVAYEARIKQIESDKDAEIKKFNNYRLVSILILIAVTSYMIYSRYAMAKKMNRILEEKQTELNLLLNHLRQTEEQLKQIEKMATLGELTAGIAHEIQNPLNFVNNFAEVNSELIDDIKTELYAGNSDEVHALADDLKDNNDKIAHHSKRADSIVKGMLKHSRISPEEKEPTDVNALTEEFLKLAYHGLRAKDKSFNATINSSFDNSIQHINVVGQDIGRVILNLITNAFYSLNEKQKLQPENYTPTINVSTKNDGNRVYITVEDNGNGVPQGVMDKIFKPFFTTKPSGLGTGLGLSLSFDIVKQHEGHIHVDSREGEGAKFTIELPV